MLFGKIELLRYNNNAGYNVFENLNSIVYFEINLVLLLFTSVL